MPVNSTAKLDNGLLEDRFEKSVKMSTYLVAFIIMDFNNRTATTKNGKQVRFLLIELLISGRFEYRFELPYSMLFVSIGLFFVFKICLFNFGS